VDRLDEAPPEHRVNLYHRFDDAIGERIPVGTALILPIPVIPLSPFNLADRSHEPRLTRLV